MSVSLPTAADVRKAREQAARSAAERARTPLLAVLGAGDVAVTTVTEAVAELPQRLSVDELRKAVTGFRTELRTQAGETYADLAERGEQAWGRLRQQPQVKQALAVIETYTEKLDARVDDLVDDVHDAAEKALRLVTRQTRSTGEKVARATQRVAREVADVVAEAGDEAAHATRSTTRKAANRTAPQTTAAKPATRRTATTDATGTKAGS